MTVLQESRYILYVIANLKLHLVGCICRDNVIYIIRKLNFVQIMDGIKNEVKFTKWSK